MAEVKLTVDKLNRVYLKEVVVNTLSPKKKVRCLLNADTAVLFPEKATYKDVMNSLNVLKRDLEIRVKKEEEEKKEAGK